MPFIALVFGLGGGSQIGSLRLDALLRETTRLTADVTSYPVETGEEISDNITRHAEELSLSGVVTGAGTLLFSAGGKSKLIAAKAALRQIHDDRVPVDIITGLDTYAGYAMTEITIDRGNTGEQLDVQASFRKIETAQLQRAEIPAKQVADTAPGGGPESAKQRAGKTAAKAGSASNDAVEPTDGVKAVKKSWGLSILQGVGVLE